MVSPPPTVEQEAMESASAWDVMFTLVLPDRSAVDLGGHTFETYISGWNWNRLQRAATLRADRRNAASSVMPLRWISNLENFKAS